MKFEIADVEKGALKIQYTEDMGKILYTKSKKTWCPCE
jgi:hypothetical protein